MRNRTLCLALTLGLILAAGARAEQLAASHAQAVEELLQAMDMSNLLDRSIDAMLQAQAEGNPQLKPLQGVMREFMSKYMSWESLKPGLVQLYGEAFTEPEVRELIAFYRTPLGQKMITRMPELMQKGMALGQKAVQEHLPELREAIAKAMKDKP